MYRYTKCIGICLLILPLVLAHADGEHLSVEGYEFELVKDGNRFGLVTEYEDLNVQAQIMDDKGVDIYYTDTEELNKTYWATWRPLPGDYQIQFIARIDGKILKPTYNITASRLPWDAILGVLGLLFVIGRWRYRRKLWYGYLLGGVLIVIAAGIYLYQPAPIACDSEGCLLPIHWHAELNISVCGNEVFLPEEVGDLNAQHTHNDTNRLHLHAMTKMNVDQTALLTPDQHKLGDVFQQTGIRFNSTCFSSYCNGDACIGSGAGKLRMTVNGEANTEYDEYVWIDGDEIAIVFE